MSTTGWILTIGGLALGLVGFVLVKKSVYVIHEDQLGIVERFGKFVKVAKPGPLVMAPFVTKLVARLDMRFRNVDFGVNARTNDSATATAHVFLEFTVDGNSAYEAHYDLRHPDRQLTARATEIVSALLYTMTLEEAMAGSKLIGDKLRDELTAYAATHGYLITNIVITSVEPEKAILSTMSEKAALDRRN